MTKLMVIQLHYSEHNKKFHHIRNEMEYELPDESSTIVMEAYGEFLTRYYRKDFGNIHIDMNRKRAYYMGIYDSAKDYDAVVEQMKETLISRFIEEADRMMKIAMGLKKVGL